MKPLLELLLAIAIAVPSIKAQDSCILSCEATPFYISGGADPYYQTANLWCFNVTQPGFGTYTNCIPSTPCNPGQISTVPATVCYNTTSTTSSKASSSATPTVSVPITTTSLLASSSSKTDNINPESTSASISTSSGSGLSGAAIGGIVGGILGVFFFVTIGIVCYLIARGRKSPSVVTAPTLGAPATEKNDLFDPEDHESAVDVEIGGRLASSANGNGDGPVGGRLRYPDENVIVGGRLGSFS